MILKGWNLRTLLASSPQGEDGQMQGTNELPESGPIKVSYALNKLVNKLLNKPLFCFFLIVLLFNLGPFEPGLWDIICSTC